MNSNLIEFIGLFGGVSAVIGGISAWLSKLWADRILQKKISEYEKDIAILTAELEKEINRSQSQLDLVKEYSIRYSEHQFKLYNELWGELYSLEINAQALWDNATPPNMSSFVKQLKLTKDQIKKNALLIEKNHLSDLLTLLKEFEDYQLGKQSLIKYRNSNSPLQSDEIKRMIENNKDLKTKYSKILMELEGEFRRQVKDYIK